MARPTVSEDSEDCSNSSEDDTETTVSIAHGVTLKSTLFVVGPTDDALPTSSGVYYGTWSNPDNIKDYFSHGEKIVTSWALTYR